MEIFNLKVNFPIRLPRKACKAPSPLASPRNLHHFGFTCIDQVTLMHIFTFTTRGDGRQTGALYWYFPLRHIGMMMIWHNKTTLCLYLVSCTFHFPIFITQTETPWSQTSTCSQTPLKVVPACTTSVGGETYHTIISYHTMPSSNIGLFYPSVPLRHGNGMEIYFSPSHQDVKLLPRSTDISMGKRGSDTTGLAVLLSEAQRQLL